ncbi:MAG TPA: ATP-binding protein [Dissulfurispiraceae bacterium]|nr:ATP-binding protein [Dissulfurispiraceae bacterium]
MSDKKYGKTHIYLVIILLAASIAILISTFVIYRNSLNAAEEALQLQALGIAASLEPSLQEKNVNKDIFRDIITEASWEGIAFIALYDKEGLTLLHSNENLTGRRIDSPSIKTCAGENRPVFGSMLLGTEEEVFTVDYPIHARDEIKVLRLALHPYPAQNIVRQARLQAISIAIAVIILWIMGFFFITAVLRAEKLSSMMAERERLAVIGEMAAVLAHEIRNPLGSIKGFAQFLSEKGLGGSSELGVIVEEAARLERLTEDLLLYASPSVVRAEEFNLSDLAGETVRMIEEPYRIGNQITITSTVPPDIVLVSDREKLKQVLVNLIRNSIDAVDEGGFVEIEAEQAGNKIIIIVRDDGCGMDEETKSRAFSSFFTGKAKGTGLGLAIVEKLTNALNGTIEIESAPASGTIVRLTLPSKLHEEKDE